MEWIIELNEGRRPKAGVSECVVACRMCGSLWNIRCAAHSSYYYFLMTPLSHAVQSWQFVECVVACRIQDIQEIQEKQLPWMP